MRATHDYDFRDVMYFFLSIFFAMMLSVFPLISSWFVYFQPDWVFLVLMFWFFVAPEILSLVWFFAIGLFYDLLLSSPLGLHALSYSIMAFVFSRMASRLAKFPLWQQILTVMGVCFLQSFGAFCILRCVDQQPSFLQLLSTVATNVVIWPVVYQLLYSIWRKRLRVC